MKAIVVATALFVGACSRNAVAELHVNELPYASGEGLISRDPVTYRSSADVRQVVPLAGASKVVIISGGTREKRLIVVDAPPGAVELSGRFVRSIGGYHHTIAADFEWRSKQPSDVGFKVSREGEALVLRSPSFEFMHHSATFETIKIGLPWAMPVELQYEFSDGNIGRD